MLITPFLALERLRSMSASLHTQRACQGGEPTRAPASWGGGLESRGRGVRSLIPSRRAETSLQVRQLAGMPSRSRSLPQAPEDRLQCRLWHGQGGEGLVVGKK